MDIQTLVNELSIIYDIYYNTDITPTEKINGTKLL